ncbi:MAG: translation initiation factor [Rikenellaceae bacterium]|nr:translation initiation factor [Rikenellaceae bacterium]
MSSNDWKKRLNVVYSTNPDFNYESGKDIENDAVAPHKQDLRVWLDRKNRGGKVATIVKGYVGPDDALKELCRELKTKCGVGGSAKNGEIIIQGDFRDRVVDLLVKAGYRAKKAGG